jgi:hypothetical protein
MLELQLGLWNNLLVGDVGARLRSSLYMLEKPYVSAVDSPYLFACWAQSLDNARVLIETGIRLLKQAVDDINNPPPIGV